MDATTFAVTYDVTADHPVTAIDRATDRLARALPADVEYVVRGERVNSLEADGGEFAVTLLVSLTRVAPRIRTNLAFHAFFPNADIEAV
ncbi:hypothetical protein ACFPYI_12560 [Halomarina salina]|uniref:Uncharacterized protein n=1 Tax=Halomarina salina TaxID=1872699 RepID=A0ABD5RPC1_9EURY|nr:hypothetical protein [Halomarina salina]